MKNTYINISLITLLICVLASNIQSQNKARFEVRYNEDDCAYEAYAVITETFDGTRQLLGPSGFTVVFDAEAPDDQLIATSVNPATATWADNSPALGDPVETLDYHKFATNGGAFSNSLTFNRDDEILLFTFSFTDMNRRCLSTIRMFDNDTDINPEGITFENSFQLGGRGETYDGNVTSASIVLPTPDAVPSFDCTPSQLNLASNPVAGYPACGQPYSFSWTGPDDFTSDLENPTISDPDASTANGTYTVMITDQNQCQMSRSIIVNGQNCAALPVELVEFQVRKSKSTVALQWKTAGEIDNDFFDIEHSSDGRRFIKIGQIQGSGTTSALQAYGFMHSEPTIGLNFYRLKQVDYNGAFEYSEIKVVNFENRDVHTYDVFPNPTKSYLNVRLSAEEKHTLLIFNSVGQRLKSLTVQGQEEINVSEFPAGLYLVEIRDDKDQMVLKRKIQVIK